LISGIVEDYLTTIYRLEEIYGYAKTTHIAKELNVKPATVTKVINKLVNKGLVTRVKYRGMKLTKKGRVIAEKIIRKHRILEVFLSDFLGFNLYESHRLAHQLEHMPDKLVERIYEKLGKPSLCPHGNLIPGAEGGELPKAISLWEATEGKCYKVLRIAGELNYVLSKLNDIGIDIGTVIKLLMARGTYYELSVGPDKAKVMFDDLVLRSLYVKEVKCAG